MMYSTMGAPLSEREEAVIRGRWAVLEGTARYLSIEPGPVERGQDVVQMLDHATALVMAVSEFRSAVSNGWHYANKRAFPAPDKSVLGPMRRPRNAVTKEQALKQLGITEADLDAFLSITTVTQESKP